MNTEPNLRDTLQQNAVSVYQDNSMDDFPVLKAFQQYIDAEQEKARRRMISLCICFAVLLGVVISVSLALLYAMNERNQSLNDRLVEYAIKDRERDRQDARDAQAHPSQNDAALKAMADTLVSLQKQLLEAKSQAAAPAAPLQTPEQAAAEARQREEAEKLIRAKAMLDAEKKMFAEEKERHRQEEIERHRRRLYPEYYAKKEAATGEAAAPAPQKPAKPRLTDADIQEILREADGGTQKPAPTAKKSDAELDDDSAIEYFKDDDEYQIPVDFKGKKSNWRVPLD